MAQAKDFNPTGRPLTVQVDRVVVIVGVGVDEGASGVFETSLFCIPVVPVQGAVEVVVVVAVVVVLVTVEVISVMGTKDEQKAEAFKATKIALHVSTLLRTSSSARGTFTAETDKRRTKPLRQVRRKCMIRCRCPSSWLCVRLRLLCQQDRREHVTICSEREDH